MTNVSFWGGLLALLMIAGPVLAQTPHDAPPPPEAATTESPAPAAPAPAASPPATAAPEASATAAPANAAAAPSGAQPPATSTSPPADNSGATTPQAAEAAPPPPEPTLIANVDLAAQSVTISENGVEKYTWPISSGTRGYRTRTGTFSPTWTSRMHYSRQWDWAPMPYAVFFNRGIAFHGTRATGMLGRPASHGCVRLATANAKTLYNLVHKHGTKMTRVIVHGAPQFKEPEVASRRGSSRYASRSRYGRYAYSDPYFYEPPPRRRRYVGRPVYRGPFGGLWD